MLVKSRAWITYAFVAAGLFYVTFLLYNTGTLSKVTASEWPHFGQQSAAEAERIESDTSPWSNQNIDPATIRTHPHKSSPALSSFSSTSPTPAVQIESAASASSPAPQSTSTLAITTFLTGQASDDTYFNSTRLLAYQLLHAPETRIQNPNLTFVVLCGKKLSEEKKDRLRQDGATVITLDDVELPSWIHIGEERWSEQFTKLRVFQRTEYKRILYIDADYLIMHRMDDIFEDPLVKTLTPTLFSRSGEIKEDEGPLPKQWLFAARSENGGIDGFEHPVPPLQTSYANAGFFLIAPDEDMYDHFMSVMQVDGRFSTQFMEQDMLNYIFRREGPMPWRELHWQWSANFVNQDDVQAGVRSLHGKFWKEGPEEAQERWKSVMQEMIEFQQKMI